MIYEFQAQLGDQRQKDGLTAVKRYFLDQGQSIVDVSENPDYFDRGIDLIRKLPGDEEYIDVKTDFQAHLTGNVPVELVEVCSKNGYMKPGWIFTDIHEIIYYVHETRDIYQISMQELRDLTFGRSLKGFASAHISPKQYFTLGVLLPLSELEAWKKQSSN